MPFTAKVLAGAAGFLLPLIAGSGIAGAAPDTSAIVNSTCTYPQVTAALNAQSPDAARELESNPMATAWLQQLVASPPEQRQQMVEQAQDLPAVQEYSGLIAQVVNTCNNF
jgi:hemophore-related protein